MRQSKMYDSMTLHRVTQTKRNVVELMPIPQSFPTSPPQVRLVSIFLRNVAVPER